MANLSPQIRRQISEIVKKELEPLMTGKNADMLHQHDFPFVFSGGGGSHVDGIRIDGGPELQGTLNLVSGGNITLSRDGSEISLAARGDNVFFTVGSSDADYITDGTADDVQIQAAIDAAEAAGGGIVHIKEASYAISTSVQLKDNVILQGDGEGTVFLLDSSIDLPVIHVNGINDAQIRDLKVSGNSAGQSTTDDHLGSGISIRGTSDSIYLKNVHVTDCASNGIYGSGTLSNINIVDCQSDNNVKRGCHVSGDNVKVIGGAFHTNTVDGLQFGDTTTNSIALGCFSHDNTEKGIEVQVSSEHCTIEACHVYDNGDVGIAFQQAGDRNKILGCEVYGNASHGIHIDLSGGSASQYALIMGNTVLNNGDTIGTMNIAIDESDYARIIGNHVEGGSRHNIQLKSADNCIVSGNVCINGSRSTGTTNGSGIELEGNSLNNIITGNQCLDIQGTPTQKYGIEITSGSNNNIVTGNQLSGNVTAELIDSGTGNKVRDNEGWATENSGTATISNGATSVTVTHGLDVTPTVDDISVVLAENPTNDPGNIWVDTITSTQFNVNCRSDPGASNLDVAWRAQVL